MLTGMIFVLLAAIGFWWFRSKDKKVSKKIFYSFLALGVLLAIFSIDTDDTEAALNFDKEAEKNVQLSDEVTELKSNNVELQEKLEALTEEFATVNEDHDKQLEAYDSITAENETLTEEIDTLKSDNSTLQKKLDNQERTSVASAGEQSSKRAKSSETGKSDTSSKNAGEKTTKKESKESSVSTTADASSTSTGDCKIKGSQTKIYHVPGSTYYNQTKNVAQWFCSEQEAENAGYRAPKR